MRDPRYLAGFRTRPASTVEIGLDWGILSAYAFRARDGNFYTGERAVSSVAAGSADWPEG
jgi:hypothetical protein